MIGNRRYLFLLTILAFIISCIQQHDNDLQKLIPNFVKDSVFLSSVNNFTKDKAELGRYLFYDRRLSINNTKACASCHAQEFSFTDQYKRSIGALGDLHQRNAKPLINIVFEKYLTAADSSIRFPEQQINNPLFNEHPVELGIKGNEEKILLKIKTDKYYQQQFKKIFRGDDDPVSIKNIQYSITSFVKTIITFNTAYDDYAFKNNKKAMSEGDINGMKLFFSDKLNCSSCHAGINFSSPAAINEVKDFYFNTGLYNIDEKGAYPLYDQGLIALTHKPEDMGKYKVPTLRNLAFTAPYFHDGSAATLEEVVNIYEAGGRMIKDGAYKGDGRKNPYKHQLINGFKLNSQERKDLIGFLLSLTDSSIIKNPAYANPFSTEAN